MACIMNATINYAIAEDYVDPLYTLDSKAERMVYANQMAYKYNISASDLKRTIKGESGWKPTAIGDGGYSIGMCQIHLPSHPSVSREQALDPKFCLEWTAEKFSQGKARMWTAYRNL